MSANAEYEAHATYAKAVVMLASIKFQIFNLQTTCRLVQLLVSLLCCLCRLSAVRQRLSAYRLCVLDTLGHLRLCRSEQCWYGYGASQTPSSRYQTQSAVWLSGSTLISINEVTLH